MSRDEQRLLIITFVGGLASIVAGACVIGGPIALVRALKPTHFFLGSLAFGTAVYIVIVVLVAKARLRQPPGRAKGRFDLVAACVGWVVYIAVGLDRFGCGHQVCGVRRVPGDAPAWSWFTGWLNVLGQAPPCGKVHPAARPDT